MANPVTHLEKTIAGEVQPVTHLEQVIAEYGGGGGGGGFTPTDAQLAAMNSGITSEGVEQIETNKNNISSLSPNSYQELTPANNNITVLSGGYVSVGNIIIISARISIVSAQNANIFEGLPKIKAESTITTGQALSMVNAVSVTASVDDTNLILFNSEYSGVIAVAGNHSAMAAGTYVISGIYLRA